MCRDSYSSCLLSSISCFLSRACCVSCLVPSYLVLLRMHRSVGKREPPHVLCVASPSCFVSPVLCFLSRVSPIPAWSLLPPIIYIVYFNLHVQKKEERRGNTIFNFPMSSYLIISKYYLRVSYLLTVQYLILHIYCRISLKYLLYESYFRSRISYHVFCIFYLLSIISYIISIFRISNVFYFLIPISYFFLIIHIIELNHIIIIIYIFRKIYQVQRKNRTSKSENHIRFRPFPKFPGNAIFPGNEVLFFFSLFTNNNNVPTPAKKNQNL